MADDFLLDFTGRFGFCPSNEQLISPPVIDIYLAGPLTHCDPAVQSECDAIRAAVKSAFQDYDYLGVKFKVYDPAEVTAPGTNHSAQEVYITDHKCTVCADAVFFHVNAASLGVGIESQLSASATTPRVVLRKRSTPNSRMFAGLNSTTIAEIVYDNPMDVHIGLMQMRQEICPAIIESAERRRPHMEMVKQQRIGQNFLMQRIRKGIRLSEVAIKTDIPEFWLREIERCPELGCTLSVMNIERISDVLGCSVKNQERTFELTDVGKPLIGPQVSSLENLATYLTSRQSFSEERVFGIWNGYHKEDEQLREEAKRLRSTSGNIEPLSPDDWKQRYEDKNLFQ